MAEKWVRFKAKEPKHPLRRQLGIPDNRQVPITLLEAIAKAPVGSTVKNPTSVGHPTVKVTALAKERAEKTVTLMRANAKRR